MFMVHLQKFQILLNSSFTTNKFNFDLLLVLLAYQTDDGLTKASVLRKEKFTELIR